MMIGRWISTLFLFPLGTVWPQIGQWLPFLCIRYFQAMIYMSRLHTVKMSKALIQKPEISEGAFFPRFNGVYIQAWVFQPSCINTVCVHLYFLWVFIHSKYISLSVLQKHLFKSAHFFTMRPEHLTQIAAEVGKAWLPYLVYYLY